MLGAALSLLLSTVSLASSAATEEIFIEGGSQGRISAVLETPDSLKEGDKIPAVILCHGFIGSKNDTLIVELSKALTSRGIAAVRFDFDAHGQSEGDFAKMSIDTELADAKAVFDYLKTRPYVAAIGAAGHSQGGVIAAMLACDKGYPSVRAAALISTAAVLKDDVLRNMLYGARFSGRGADRRIVFLDKYVIEGPYIEAARKLDIYKDARDYMGPVLLMHGAEDTVVPYTYSEHLAEEFPHNDLRIYEGLGHMFSKHEEKIAGEAADFLKTNLAF